MRRGRSGSPGNGWMLGAAALLPLVLAGCSGCPRPGGGPTVTAVGTILFDPDLLSSPGDVRGADRRSFLGTQEAQLNARSMSERVAERLDLEPTPRLVSGRAQRDAWVLEVRGHHPDPEVSRRACNAAMDLFLTERQDEVRAPLVARQRALAQHLDALPEDVPERAALRHDLDLLALQLTGAPTDAHVLEPCRNP